MVTAGFSAPAGQSFLFLLCAIVTAGLLVSTIVFLKSIKTIGLLTNENVSLQNQNSEHTAALKSSEEQYIQSLTDAKTAVDELQYIVNSQHNLYDNTPVMCFVVNEVGTIIKANKFAADTLGYPQNELTGNSVFLLFPPEQMQTAGEHIMECARNLYAVRTWEVKRITKDGTLLTVHETARAFRNTQGNIEIFIICEDITQKKEDELLLNRSNSLLSATLESISDGLISVDNDNNIIMHNRKFLELWNIPEELLLNKKTTAVTQYIIEQVMSSDAVSELIQVFALLPDVEGDSTLHLKDGRTIEWLSLPQKAGADTIGRIHCFRDISVQERIKTLQELHSGILYGMAEGVCFVNHLSQIAATNPAMNAMFGYDAEELVGQHISTLSGSPEQNETFEKLIKASILEKGYWDGETINKRKDNINIISHVRAYPVKNSNEYTMVTIWEDITERKATEEKLLQSEEQYRRVVENINDALIIDDVFGRIMYANEQFLRLFGYEKTEIHYMPLERYIAPESLNDVISRHQRRINGEYTPGTYEYMGRTKDDTVIWLEATVVVVYDKAGNIIGTQSIERDITKRKQAEEDLRKKEALLSTAQSIAKMGGWESDIPLNTVAWTDETYRIFEVDPLRFGHTFEEFIQLVHPEDRETVAEAYTAAIENRLPYFIEHRLLFPDGRTKYIREQGEIIYDYDGNPVRSVGTSQDITQFKILEQQVEGERNLNQAILENAGALVVVLDVEGRICRFNKAAEKLSGYSLEEIIGKSPWDTFLLADQSEKIKHEAFLRQMKSPHQFQEFYKNYWVHKNGSKRLIEWSNTLLLDKAGNAEYMVSVGIDITEKVEAVVNLQKSEEQYRNVLENMHDGLMIDDVEGTVQFANDQFLKIFGFDKSDIGFIKLEDYISPEFRDMLRQRHNLRINGHSMPTGFEFEGIRKDGSPLWLETSVMTLYDNEGTIIGTQSSIRDVTQRKQAELDREHYRQILENTSTLANIGGWEVDTATRSVRFTSQMYKILGMAEDHVPFIHEIRHYTEPETGARLTELIEDSFLNGRDWEGEFPLITDDGRDIIVSIVAKTELIGGKVVRIWGTMQDITSRKIVENALVESESSNRLILDMMPDAIVIIDTTGLIVRVNERVSSVFGYAPDELFGKKVEVLVPMKYRHSHEILRADYTLHPGPRQMGIDQDLTALHKDGHEFQVNISLAPLRMNGQNVIMAAIRDITERKIWDKHMMRSQRMDSIGTLASGIAHDLNNILTPVLISIPIIRAEISNKRIQELLRMMETNTKRGADLIKQVLSFARGMEGERIPLSIRYLVEDIATFIRQTFSKIIRLQVNINHDLPMTIGDATQLHQVLLNLCVNARDAMPHGGTISITAEPFTIAEQYAVMNPDARMGDYILIKVSDQGIGIPQSALDRIFEPFFTTKEHGKGTGLGLSTVHTIVKSHNGFITVYSEVDKGTLFNVYLPATPQYASDTVSSLSKQSPDAPAGNGELLLIVDDEDNIRNSTKLILEIHGYKTVTAADGADALALYAQHRHEIALVITDVMMPNMDGTALIRVLKKINPDVKVIAVSGLKQDIETYDSTVRLLPKPYSTETMLFAIKEILSRS